MFSLLVSLFPGGLIKKKKKKPCISLFPEVGKVSQSDQESTFQFLVKMHQMVSECTVGDPWARRLGLKKSMNRSCSRQSEKVRPSDIFSLACSTESNGEEEQTLSLTHIQQYLERPLPFLYFFLSLLFPTTQADRNWHLYNLFKTRLHTVGIILLAFWGLKRQSSFAELQINLIMPLLWDYMRLATNITIRWC